MQGYIKGRQSKSPRPGRTWQGAEEGHCMSRQPGRAVQGACVRQGKARCLR
jgi:hypothetical protein